MQKIHQQGSGRAVSNKSDDAMLRGAAARIRLRMSRSAQDMVEIGFDLVIVKSKLGHGRFLQWIEAEFGMTDRTARNIMSVYKTFGSESETVSELPPKVLYALAAPTTAPEVRDEAIEMAKSGKKVTSKVVAELKAKLKEVTEQRKHSTDVNRRLTHDLHVAECIRDQTTNDAADLRAKVEAFEATGVAPNPAVIANTVASFMAVWAMAHELAREQIKTIVNKTGPAAPAVIFADIVTMTDDKKALADLPGFRVGSDGVVEALTRREVDVLISRVIREAMQSGLAPRGKVTRGK